MSTTLLYHPFSLIHSTNTQQVYDKRFLIYFIKIISSSNATHLKICHGISSSFSFTSNLFLISFHNEHWKVYIERNEKWIKRRVEEAKKTEKQFEQSATWFSDCCFLFFSRFILKEELFLLIGFFPLLFSICIAALICLERDRWLDVLENNKGNTSRREDL